MERTSTYKGTTPVVRQLGADLAHLATSVAHQGGSATITASNVSEYLLENDDTMEVSGTPKDGDLYRDEESSASNFMNGEREQGCQSVSTVTNIFSGGQVNGSIHRHSMWAPWVLAVFLGQFISLMLCMAATTTVYLVDKYNLQISNVQNFAFYVTLSSIFTSVLAWRPGEANLFPVLKSRGWKYALVALADAEGNYLVVKAYQYTTLTSVQLLDCFTIPTVLFLSWFFLRIRYRPMHIIGVATCVVGVSCLIWADAKKEVTLGVDYKQVIGDILCLSAAFLYGVVDVAQEFLVKRFDIVEYLGMVGLFGSVVTGVQCVFLESDQITEGVIAGSPVPIALLLGFVIAQLSFYIGAGLLIRLSGATTYILSILTADFYSLILGIYLFQYEFEALYFVSFFLIIFGVIVYSLTPSFVALHSAATTRDMSF